MQNVKCAKHCYHYLVEFFNAYGMINKLIKKKFPLQFKYLFVTMFNKMHIAVQKISDLQCDIAFNFSD